MFSYTDDAIVTSSPTGRHLSTVIRRPAAIGPLDWNEHADQVCKVLNELDRNAKLNYRVCYSLGAGFQKVGRVKRDTELDEAIAAVLPNGPTAAELIDAGYLSPIPRYRRTEAEPVPATPEQRIAELEKQLDDATTKLTAAQMLLEKPIEVTADLARLLQKGKPGDMFIANRTFKRVE